jgi:hypothetical protein
VTRAKSDIAWLLSVALQSKQKALEEALARKNQKGKKKERKQATAASTSDMSPGTRRTQALGQL